MSIIDQTYFEKRLLAIPNLDKEYVSENLDNFIEEYEDAYLDTMLGTKLKNQFIAGLAVLPTPDQIWLDLLNGKEYDISGITYRWQGFNNDKKLSPIADYVFCKFTTDNQFLNTGVSDSKPAIENGTVIAPHYRTGRVWNEMVKLNHDLIRFLQEFESDYPDWYFCYNTPLLNTANVIGL